MPTATDVAGGTLPVFNRPYEWSVKHTPAANTVATISKAAVATQRHVCTGFTASVASDGTVTPANLLVTLRDGATGAGTILQAISLSLIATAGTSAVYGVSGLNIIGTLNTAMTIEFAAAGGANTYENVSMTGYSVTPG